MKYVFSKQAIGDLEQIKYWGFEEFGEGLTIKYLTELRLKIVIIAKNPMLYQSVEYIRKNYRRAPYKAHSIYYTIEKDFIIIKRIIGKQNF